MTRKTQKERLRQDARDHEQRQKERAVANSQNEEGDAQNGQSYSRFAVGNDFFKTKGRVSKRDGRLKISAMYGQAQRPATTARR